MHGGERDARRCENLRRGPRFEKEVNLLVVSRKGRGRGKAGEHGHAAGDMPQGARRTVPQEHRDVQYMDAIDTTAPQGVVAQLLNLVRV
jgi:hypothetical protein